MFTPSCLNYLIDIGPHEWAVNYCSGSTSMLMYTHAIQIQVVHLDRNTSKYNQTSEFECVSCIQPGAYPTEASMLAQQLVSVQEYLYMLRCSVGGIFNSGNAH